MKFKVTVGKTTLLSFLKKTFADEYSAKFLKKILHDKRCYVNRELEQRGSRELLHGDTVTLDLSDIDKELTAPILYEEEGFFVCDKPAGAICSVDSLQKILNRKDLFLVHRLDKETSGALLIAKSKTMQEKLITLFRKREVDKIYLAVVDGTFKKNEGKIENYLSKKGGSEGQSIWGSTSKERGVIAITFWKSLKKGKDCTLLACRPITGRTHQLRVHLSEIGHPILGDYQYGKRFLCKKKPRRHLLHAYQISFYHPINKEKIEIRGAIPKDFSDYCL